MRIFEVLAGIAISLFCLLGLFLLSNKSARQKGFVWFGFFFLLLALNFLDGIFLLNGLYFDFPRLAFWEDPNVFLYGPLIYFFSLQIANRSVRWNVRSILHFIPYIVFEIAVIFYHIGTPVEEVKILLQEIVSQRIGANVLIGILPIFAHVIGYMLYAYLTLSKHRGRLKQYYSFIEISWAFSLIRTVLFTFLFSLAITFVQYLGSKEVFSILLVVLNSIVVLLMARILLFALKQPMFQVVTHKQTFKLPDVEEDKLRLQIEKLLSEEKLYTDPNLSLKDLANKLQVSDREVSYVVNNTMADNFYDLINHYRIAEAKRILMENTDPKLTILELLYRVGYNSKSSFNTQFKKKTGMTPSEFKKSLHP